ncbi:hypothetical protein BKA69DRAFT_1041979 [Paraphysoderma sedebokerense]|nr:hypothetical protein BKA69DRAFT_1041979 [Paraphysoderma sedebokerense]
MAILSNERKNANQRYCRIWTGIFISALIIACLLMIVHNVKPLLVQDLSILQNEIAKWETGKAKLEQSTWTATVNIQDKSTSNVTATLQQQLSKSNSEGWSEILYRTQNADKTIPNFGYQRQEGQILLNESDFERGRNVDELVVVNLTWSVGNGASSSQTVQVPYKIVQTRDRASLGCGCTDSHAIRAYYRGAWNDVKGLCTYTYYLGYICLKAAFVDGNYVFNPSDISCFNNMPTKIDSLDCKNFDTELAKLSYIQAASNIPGYYRTSQKNLTVEVKDSTDPIIWVEKETKGTFKISFQGARSPVFISSVVFFSLAGVSAFMILFYRRKVISSRADESVWPYGRSNTSSTGIQQHNPPPPYSLQAPPSAPPLYS